MPRIRIHTAPNRFCCLAMGLMALLSSAVGRAQESTVVNPRMFGFPLPPGQVRWADRPVHAQIQTDQGVVVGKVHVKVGDDFVVILPDGRLEGKRNSEVQFTDQPVEWATPEEIAKQVTQHEMLKDFKVMTGKRHVFVYNTTEEMAEVTSRIMESMTRGLVKYMKTLGLETHDPEVPLVVIMFRTQDEFQAFKRMPPGVIAYYNIITNHVCLYEESDLLKLDRNLAIRQALSTIAHEGAHQILANIGVQQRLSLWPMWLSEGMAEYLAPTSVSRGIQWKGAGQINDFRMLELETHLRSEAIDGIDGGTLRDTIGAARLTSTGYAAAWSLTTFLSKRYRKEFRELLRETAALRPFEGSFPTLAVQGKIEKNIEQFERHFGKEFQELETDMIQYLSRQKFESPFAAFVHYAVLVEIPSDKRPRNEKRTAVFHTEELAQRWASEFAGKNSDNGQPAIRIIRCPNRAEAIRQTHLFYNTR